MSEEVARSELEAIEGDARYMRYSIKIGNSESQSENTKDRQQMPSIRL